MSVAGALNGVRILDFTRILAGPFCTMLLGDYGADVIKIERPGSGDDTRHWGPPWAGEHSAYYLSINRNKRSLTLNLQSAEGQTLARALALQSDILIENFKVGQMKAYGLDYERLRAEHPGLIYCSITGYGQTSPYAERPGYDFVIQAESGLMSITGPVEGEPYKVGVAISDVTTGLTAANAIQAALYHRMQTGQGQYIDVALLDSQLAALVNVAANYLVSGQPPARYGNAHPSIVPYELFEAADQPFVLGVGTNHQFRQVCHLMGQPDLADDPRFATNPARVTNRQALIAIMQPIFRQQPAQKWIDACLAVGVPAGLMRDVSAALTDPHVRARGLIQSVELDDGTAVDLLASAAQLTATPPIIRRPPPLLGQHTEEVLRDLLNMDSHRIDDLRVRGVI